MPWDSRPRPHDDELRGQWNRLLEDFLGGGRPARSGRAFPEVNVWIDDEDRLHVEAELPGVAPDAVQVTVEDDVLTLRGERTAPGGEELRWHRRERGTGSFTRTLRLPIAVEASQVEAVFVNGVLSVTLPRAEKTRARKIEIKAS